MRPAQRATTTATTSNRSSSNVPAGTIHHGFSPLAGTFKELVPHRAELGVDPRVFGIGTAGVVAVDYVAVGAGGARIDGDAAAVVVADDVALSVLAGDVVATSNSVTGYSAVVVVQCFSDIAVEAAV